MFTSRRQDQIICSHSSKSLSCSLFYAPVPLDGMFLPVEKSKGQRFLPSWYFAAGTQLLLEFCQLNQLHLPATKEMWDISDSKTGKPADTYSKKSCESYGIVLKNSHRSNLLISSYYSFHLIELIKWSSLPYKYKQQAEIYSSLLFSTTV